MCVRGQDVADSNPPDNNLPNKLVHPIKTARRNLGKLPAIKVSYLFRFRTSDQGVVLVADAGTLCNGNATLSGYEGSNKVNLLQAVIESSGEKFFPEPRYRLRLDYCLIFT